MAKQNKIRQAPLAACCNGGRRAFITALRLPWQQLLAVLGAAHSRFINRVVRWGMNERACAEFCSERGEKRRRSKPFLPICWLSLRSQGQGGLLSARGKIQVGLWLVALLWLLPQPISSNCGFRPALYTYRFLDAQVLGFDPQISPLFTAFGDLFEKEMPLDEELQKRDNLQEWYERYCEGVAITDLDKIIYGRSDNALRDLKRVMDQADSRLADLRPEVRANSFTRHLFKYGCREVVDYLIFAKTCEPVVSRPQNSFSTEPPVGNARQQLIESGRKKFMATKSHYIRLRYAYQLVRLAHYDKNYDQALELYAFLRPKIDADPSIIYHWLEGHRAAALRQKGQVVEANYIYSRIFAECPSKQASAYQSFSVSSDEEWQQLLIRCNNDPERANLYVLRAQNPKAQLVPEMDSIYRYNPKAKALELLLVRELQKLEKDLMGIDVNPRKQSNRLHGIPRPIARQRLIALQGFVIKVNQENQTARPDLWTMAEGYLNLLAGDYFAARKIFAQLSNSKTIDEKLQKQLNIAKQVLDLLLIDRLNDSMEMAYYNLLRDDELRSTYPDFNRLITDKFRQVYRVNNERAKATLLTYGLDELKYQLDINLLNELRMIGADTLSNSFVRRLLIERGGPEVNNHLKDMQATYYLQNGQLAAAARIFNTIPEENWNDYGIFRPFEPLLNDRIHQPPLDVIARSYNKGEMMQRMLALEKEAEEAIDANEASKKFFTLGLAYYNISYFGYAWKAADYFRSGSSAARAARGEGDNFVFSNRSTPYGNYEAMNMERARYYFELARTRAVDPEQAAICTFFAAKVERNMNYSKGHPRTFGYFRILTDYYKDTKFYEKAIEECRTFAWYSGRM